MSQHSFRDKKETSTLSEGVFIPQIDYNMAVWMAYLNCIQIPVIGRHTESFASVVRILDAMILPEWETPEYKQQIAISADPLIRFGAITKLLHQRGFFKEIKGNDFGHL
jgi:hypothetical protein